ncbi:hypothetical protein [Roseivirga misakiensis]|uniref:HTH luxR-type domain-containing protein n=1 Tax=Roseivirga misakiensis TaxID=1563681 RepID=A0A1E5T7S8_9BACT|nr:hypothetical protein [Roseivirga misakiensis]OEK07435.1 hypothetical protein BFP71_00050 [Roseivirga misakiensis]
MTKKTALALLIAGLIILVTSNAHAQETRRIKIDTLLQKLPTLKEDEAGAQILYLLGARYIDVNLDSALFFFNKSLALSEKLEYSENIVATKKGLGTTYGYIGDLDKAIAIYEETYQEALTTENFYGALYVLNDLMVNVNRKGDSLKTKTILREGYALAPKVDSDSSYFISLYDITHAKLYYSYAKYDSAFFYWERARDYMMKINFRAYGAIITNDMATAYFALYDYPNALKANKEALELATAIDYRPVELEAQRGIARVYAAIDNADLAIETLIPVYEEQKQYGHPFRMLPVEMELANAYYQKEDYENALIYAKSAYTRAFKIGAKDGNVSRSANTVADIMLKLNQLDSSLFYLNVSDSIANLYEKDYSKFRNLILRTKHKNLSGKHSETFAYLEKADSLARNVLGPKQRAEVSYMQYLYYREVGDLTSALEALEKSNNLRDSLKNLEKRGDLIRLGSEIETANKQAQIKKRESEIETLTMEIDERRSKNAQVTIVLICTAVIAILMVILRVRKLKSARKLKELESEKLQDELIQKNRQLTTKALQDARKNQVLDSLLTETKNIQTSKNTDLSKLIRLAKEGINSEKKLELFTLQFEETNPNFYKNLRDLHPSLSPREEQICALVNLNFSTKEIASFLGIEAGSATTARYRLRQKLGLEKEQNLTKYLQGLNQL